MILPYRPSIMGVTRLDLCNNNSRVLPTHPAASLALSLGTSTDGQREKRLGEEG